MSARRLAAAVALAACAGALAVPVARAHPVSLGVLVLREEPGGTVDASFRFSGTEARATGAEPELPTRCLVIGVATESALPEGGVLRRGRFDCGPTGLGGARVAVRGMEGTGVQILVEVQRADGETLRARLDDGTRELEVPASGEAVPVLGRYVALGIDHIAGGIDHLLFVLGLLLLVRGGRARLLATITAFTIAHSVTMAIAVTGAIELRAAPVEACIAASILVLALELSRAEPRAATRERPWALAAAFGLLHGLGFAGGLREAGLPSGAIPEALLGFNVGVELGQLAFVAVALAGLALVRLVGANERRGREALVLAIGGAAAYFLLDRLSALGGGA